MASLEDSNSVSADDNSLVEIADGTATGSSKPRAKVDTYSRLHTHAHPRITSENPVFDAFGRTRVSFPNTIFDATFRYDKQPVIWNESVASGGTVTHSADKASVELSVTTTTNSRAIFQSRQYTRYHPGKSQMVLISGNFLNTATNVSKKIGYFDENNGTFFQLSGSILSVVRRTKTSGSVVDNTVNQADWNIDKLDGTGVSGITLDVTKQQIFVIDFQWLGSGRIRYGLDIGGNIIYCHEDNNANSLALPWSQTGDCPVRAEILNSSSTASTMHITCCAVVCENSWGPEGVIRTINNGVTSRTVGGVAGTAVPVLSLRKQTAYVDAPVQIIDYGLFANSSDDFIVSIVYNPILTGASWANVSGVCQRDVSATSFTGGTELYSGYVRGGTTPSTYISEVFHSTASSVIGRDIAGNSDIISVIATAVTASSSAYAFLNYRELV